jgi:pimeloyl-ACP methyl ester carboxylesterase
MCAAAHPVLKKRVINKNRRETKYEYMKMAKLSEKTKTSEEGGYSRRRFLANAAVAVGAAQSGLAGFAEAQADTGPVTAAAGESDIIRPFRINIPDAALDDLHRRIAATRWPDKESVADHSQGVQLATIQELARYWGTEYDWRKVEARLNALPMFRTKIDGLDIHFIHVRSKHENALPLIVTHGWPGSIIEQLKIVDPLTNPTAYGASAADAFHLVIPSMPGYGFSGKPTTTGWNPDRMATAWATLMARLGYTHYVAQGGDWGAFISNAMAEQAPPGLLGIHVNYPSTVPPEIWKALKAGDPPPSDLSADERRAYEQVNDVRAKHYGYAIEMGNRPQTLTGLSSCPVGLAAWMMDHDGRSCGQISSLFVHGQPFGDITRDDILDNITLYWLTNTAISSARLYWENQGKRSLSAVNVSIPAAVSVFPGEAYQAPRSWTEKAYHKLIYFHEVEKGGHFAAWEEPELFCAELRAAFKSLRGAQATALNQ